MIEYVETKNISISWLIPILIAIFTSPLARIKLHDFLLASLTRGIIHVLVLVMTRVHNSGFHCKEIWFIRHSKVFFFNLSTCLELIRSRGTGRPCLECSMIGKLLITSLSIVPAFKFVGFLNVWINSHGTTTQQRETSAAEIRYFDTLKSNYRF